MREAAVAATRQLAKRQLTWLRALPVHRRLDCLAGDLPKEASAIIDDLTRQDETGFDSASKANGMSTRGSS
jgi:tRNA A37 N6-isopentenylltransferase MiaA